MSFLSQFLESFAPMLSLINSLAFQWIELFQDYLKVNMQILRRSESKC